MVFFFFFQAEDGIRDADVTGVQTCALPISEDEVAKSLFTLQAPDLVVLADAGQAWLVGSGPGRLPVDRLPTLGSWLADLGLGIDWGGLGLYVAKAVTAGEPLRFTLRLDHRF